MQDPKQIPLGDNNSVSVEANSAVARLHDRMRKLVWRMETIRDEERKTLALEIHDHLGQELSALKMNIATLGARLKADEGAAEKIKQIRELVDASMQTARTITQSLRPALPDGPGLSEVLENQVRAFEADSGISCTCQMDRAITILKTDVPIAVFRILQESLRNVAKHAAASQIVVKFAAVEKDVVLTVFDNGKGIRDDDEVKDDAFGILGMKERASRVGGSVTVKRLSEKGTCVTARIPEAIQ